MWSITKLGEINKEVIKPANLRSVLRPLPLFLVNEKALSHLILVLALVAGIFLRLWQINAMGYNTDEAVYAGQAAAIAGVPGLKEIFPVFRAHPLLFQFLLSVIYMVNFNDLWGRMLSSAVGIATVLLTYNLGKTLYGRLPGAIAAAILALMPYHVIVTRQVLLDGPMVFFATATLFVLTRFGHTRKFEWLYAAGACMGLTFLSKETGIILMGAIYAFLALAPEIRVRIRDLIIATIAMAMVIAPFPLTLMLAGGSSSGRNYLVWQLFRRPNHDWTFYPTTVPPVMGELVILVAVLSIILLWRERSWREKLLVAWILVPVTFFQIWPVKGFQYLLPIAPAVAVLAGRLLGKWISSSYNARHQRMIPTIPIPQFPFSAVLSWLAVGAVTLSIGFTSWQRIQPDISTEFLAGTGGVPGGREVGTWIQANVPEHARFMTIGPSMANIIQFYGHRRAYGLAVSPNPLHRNPSYQPIVNPDLQIRQSEMQYIVWDSFSASRTSFFTDKLLNYVKKYNGRAVHTETIQMKDANGETVVKPVIIVYEVFP